MVNFRKVDVSNIDVLNFTIRVGVRSNAEVDLRRSDLTLYTQLFHNIPAKKMPL